MNATVGFGTNTPVLPNLDGLWTTPSILIEMARALPHHDALTADDRRFTFAQLHSAVRRGAARLAAVGVMPGDRVAIWLPNTWQWVVACLSIHYAGAVLVPVNTHFTADEATDILARTSTSLLIGMGRYHGEDRVGELDLDALPTLRHIVRVAFETGDGTWDDFMSGPAVKPAEVDARAEAVRPDDISDIVFTSGTTGRSKGVLATHRQSLSASRSWAQCGTLNAADRYLCINPFFHNFGYKAGILACLQTGATLIPQQTFDPAQTMQLVQDLQITVLPGPPMIYRALLDHPGRYGYDLRSLRFAVSGGAMVPVALIEGIRRDLGIDLVLTAYGQTEANGFGTMCRPGDDLLTVSTTCGRPIADFEVRIDSPDESGAGEVLLRGPNIMLGYLDDPAATATVIDHDGWLHTGDVGQLDSAGNLQITDRLTDMYICNGFNVYPAEIEQVLLRLDGVAQAAVIGVPDHLHGEVGRAFLVSSPDAELDEQTVIAHARTHLADFKTPRSVVFMSSLPRNPGGKVLKSRLRQQPPPADSRSMAAPGLGGPPVGRFEDWVARSWQILLNIDCPGRLDRFTDLGGDSGSAVEFSRMLNEQFGLNISVDWFAGHPTIADVVADLQPGERTKRQAVVPLRSDGAGPICLMIPGVGGHAWVFSGLAKALTGPLDILAFSLMDLRGRTKDRIRDDIRMAALAALRPHAAAGRPIVIAGYSFGGLVAVDLVQWLVDSGVPVERLFLLDPAPISSRKPLMSDRLRARLRRWSENPRSFIDGARRRLRGRSGEETAIGDSTLARQIEQQMADVSNALLGAYQDGSARLPSCPVSWVRSAEMAAKYRTSKRIFGTPIRCVESAVIDTDHGGLHQPAGVRQLAAWWDEQPIGDTAGRDGNQRPSQPAIHLHRDGFAPTPLVGELRDNKGVDVVPTPFGATTYLITRYEDAKAMLADHRHFSTTPPWVVSGVRSPSAYGQHDPRAGNLMLLDPPEHTRLRRMLTGQFNARRMAHLEARITEIVNDRLVTMTHAGGPVDLMQAFALPISSLVICELLGVPYSDRDEFQRRGAREFDMTISTDERVLLAEKSKDYMASLVAAARREPGKNILGMLVREHGDDLTDAELTGIGSLLLLAGHETTANMIGLGTLALLRHPDQLAIVRDDPESIGPAVEELLRWLSVVQTGTTRYTTTEVEVAGVRIPPRHPVFASVPAANRDPAFINDPDTLNLRRGATGHLAFGYGIHHCLGAPLARMEMRLALPALLRRFPDLALNEPFDQVAFRSFHFIYGLNSLLVKW